MMLTLARQIATAKSTIGQLTAGAIQCFTLEDTMRQIKIKGETCIPAGQYAITLRTEGGMHRRYLQRFGDWHKGMLWVRDIPNFEFVYLHIGNTPLDTEGCILLGVSAGTDVVYQSERAYRAIYPVVADAILAGDDVLIDVIDPR